MRVEYLTSDSKRKYTDISCSNKDYRRSSDVPAHKRTRTAANHSEFATCRKIIFDHGFFGCRPVGGEPRLGYDSPRAVDPPPGLSQSSEATLTFGAYIPESCYSHNGPGTIMLGTAVLPGPARARARDPAGMVPGSRSLSPMALAPWYGGSEQCCCGHDGN